MITLTENDKMLMMDLYNMRLLSANQIAKTYNSSLKYGYKRTRQLFKEGYLSGKPLVVDSLKQTQYYYVTDKGIRELGIDNPRKANKNFIKNKYLVERQIAINEVYIGLKHAHRLSGISNIWTWEDSRATKINYDINRGSLIAGVLTNTKTNTKYNIYLPNMRLDMLELSNKIHNEADQNTRIRNNIILCTTRDIFQHYLSDKMKFAGRSMMILPHTEGINFIYNALYDYESWLRKIIQDVLKQSPAEMERVYLPYADYKATDHYIIEMLSVDITKLHFINQYSTDYKSDRPLKVICWDTELKSLFKNRIKNTNGLVEYYPVSWAGSHMLNNIDTNKIYVPKTVENLKPEEKAQGLSITLSPKVKKYLNRKYPKGARSQYIENLIINSEEYIEYTEQGGD